MNCTICGKATLPGAMLCGPCKAALKRARYVTVQEDMRRTSIIDVRRRPRRPASPPSVSTDAVPAAPPPRQAIGQAHPMRPLMIGVAAMALLGAVAYFGQQEPSAQSHDATVTPPTMAPPAQVASVAVETKPATAAVEVSPPPVASDLATPTVAEAAPHPVPATKVAAAGGSKRAAPVTSATFATVNGDPPDATPPPPAPEKVAALPPPPPAAPAPDRWQSLRDSIALCDREGFFAGIICGQKARIQYCEGYWGKVPQCPGPTLNPDR